MFHTWPYFDLGPIISEEFSCLKFERKHGSGMPHLLHPSQHSVSWCWQWASLFSLISFCDQECQGVALLPSSHYGLEPSVYRTSFCSYPTTQQEKGEVRPWGVAQLLCILVGCCIPGSPSAHGCNQNTVFPLKYFSMSRITRLPNQWQHKEESSFMVLWAAKISKYLPVLYWEDIKDFAIPQMTQ